MKPDLLVIGPLYAPTMDLLAQHFTLYRLYEEADPQSFLDAEGHRFRALATKANYRLDDGLMSRLPRLGLIASYGAGTDGIDLAVAERRGIRVTTTPGVLSKCVADSAFALMLALVRRVNEHALFLRQGLWQQGQPPLTSKVWGQRLGIVGPGRIGSEIATRARAFDMEIACHSRNAPQSNRYPFMRDLHDLAEWADILMVTVPGGEETRGLISSGVLAASGPEGYLVSMSRPSVIDEPALCEALRRGQLAGAALDSFSTAPCLTSDLAAVPNLLLVPHIGSATLYARGAMGQMQLESLQTFFAQTLPFSSAGGQAVDESGPDEQGF